MKSFTRHLAESDAPKKGVALLHELLKMQDEQPFVQALIRDYLRSDPVFDMHMARIVQWYRDFNKMDDAGSRRKIAESMMLLSAESCPNRQPWVYEVRGAARNRIYRGKALTIDEIGIRTRFASNILRMGKEDFLVGKFDYEPAHRLQSWTTSFTVASDFAQQKYGSKQIFSSFLYEEIDSKKVVVGTSLSNAISDEFTNAIEYEVVYMGGGRSVGILVPVKQIEAALDHPTRGYHGAEKRLPDMVGRKNAEAIWSIKSLRHNPYFEKGADIVRGIAH